MVYTVAIGYRMFQPAPVVAPEPPPPPPPPPPPAKCGDEDGDGVCDADDKCPGTPAGTKVDKVGCPLEQTLKCCSTSTARSCVPIDHRARARREVHERRAVRDGLDRGHTDSVGSDAYNLALSDRRAKSVFDYLSSRGVDPSRLKSIGYGEAKPTPQRHGGRPPAEPSRHADPHGYGHVIDIQVQA